MYNEAMAARGIGTGLALVMVLGNLGGCRKKAPPKPAAPTSPPGCPTNLPTTAASRPASKRSDLLASAASAREALARQVFDPAVPGRVSSQSSPAVKANRKLADDLLRHIAAGNRALARKDAATAAKCFYRALDIEPAHPDALRGLATALAAAGRYRQVIPVYQMIHGIWPKDRTALFNLAVALSKVHRFTEASQVYRQLLAQDADDVRSRYNLAVLHQAQGKLDQARRTWREVLARAGHLPSAHTALGEVLMDLGDQQGAMLAYAEAAKLRPKSVTGWLNLATAAEAAGSYGRAIVATKRAAKLSPNDAAIWARVGELYLALHRATGKDRFLTEAVAAWRQSLKVDPAQPQLRNYVETYRPSGDDRSIRNAETADQ